MGMHILGYPVAVVLGIPPRARLHTNWNVFNVSKSRPQPDHLGRNSLRAMHRQTLNPQESRLLSCPGCTRVSDQGHSAPATTDVKYKRTLIKIQAAVTPNSFMICGALARGRRSKTCRLPCYPYSGRNTHSREGKSWPTHSRSTTN